MSAAIVSRLLVGAVVFIDGKHPARVVACFPSGSTSLLSPHYVLDVFDGDKNVKVSTTRVHATKKA